jgi:glycosyltransferase involved in cell wall biosynthesis
MTTVSVVVPCHNARQWIQDALESVMRQGIADIAIIVVDDGSTDGSGDFVGTTYPDVRLVRTEHQGPSRARNLGTSLADGEFIQYLDADDMLATGKLRGQLRELTRTGAAVAYGDWDELRAGPDGHFALSRRVQREIIGQPEIALFTDFWCPPAAYLFRQSIVQEVGGWRADLAIIQDARLALDCALHGAQFVYCPGVSAYYRRHSAGSVSSRDPVAFVRDCLLNAAEIEQWWRHKGGLNPERTRALVAVYSHVARASFARDRHTFDAAHAALEVLRPGYVPTRPYHLAAASRLLGYRRAEQLATWYRQATRKPRTALERLLRI